MCGEEITPPVCHYVRVVVIAEAERRLNPASEIDHYVMPTTGNGR
jgi:hypothetical protein